MFELLELSELLELFELLELLERRDFFSACSLKKSSSVILSRSVRASSFKYQRATEMSSAARVSISEPTARSTNMAKSLFDFLLLPSTMLSTIETDALLI